MEHMCVGRHKLSAARNVTWGDLENSSRQLHLYWRKLTDGDELNPLHINATVEGRVNLENILIIL